jgi:small-conductance mechanosensitive channel/CRP-like cAMP-binding protein
MVPNPADLGTLLVLAAVLVGVLATLWRALRRRQDPSAGSVFVLAFLAVPAAAACRTLVLYGHSRDGTAWRGCLTLAVLAGVHSVLSIVDGFVFSRARAHLANIFPKIFRDFIRWAVLLLVFFVILGSVWEFRMGELSILAGALSIALSLALGPTLGAMISGITLISERPFEIGDWIDVDGKQGRVEQITWRSTRIVTRDRERIIYPNSLLASTRVLNLSRPEPSLGIRSRVGVHYRTPPVAVEDALRRAVQGVPGVLARTPPAIRIVEFGPSSVIWEVRYFVHEPDSSEDVRAEVMRRIWYSLKRSGIEIPYPVVNFLDRDPGWDAGLGGAEAENARVLRNVDLLRGIPVFEKLPEESLRRLATAARDEAWLHGERIAVEGETGDRMFVIVDGRVKVVTGPGDAPAEVATLETGSYFGEMSLLTGSVRLATIVADGLVETISLAAPALAGELKAHPEFAQGMAEAAAARRAALEERFAKLRESREALAVPATHPSILGGIRRFFGLDRDDGAWRGP